MAGAGYLHFEAAWALVLTGLVYVICGLWTRHFRKNLFPAPEDRTWRTLRRVIANHLRLAPPSDSRTYNVLQRVTYLLVIFVLFPLVIWTGLAMSPGLNAAFPWIVDFLGGRQSARTLHFFVSISLVLFLFVHVTMVVLMGFRSRMREMITGIRAARQERITKISRRKFLTTGLAATASVAGLGATASLARRYGLVPPDCRGIYGPGETLTYAAHQLLARHSLAREFPRSMISKVPFANSIAPLNDAYKRLQQDGFAGWRISVDGMVVRPGSYSLADLRSFPVRSQITEVVCEEGWSYIAEWIGTSLTC